MSRQARLDLGDLRDTIAAAVDPAVTVGTSYDRDYLDQYTNAAPAVWVKAQRAIPISNEVGAVARPVQRFAAEVLVTVVHQRYNAGTFNAEDPVNVIAEAVIGALIFTTPTGADAPFTLAGTTDGGQDEAFITVDLLFRTEIAYHD